MAAQEITLKFRGDPSQIKEVLSDVRSAYGRTLTEIVGVSKDINAQINAMWAQRGREISAELTKELEIESAYAQQEVQTANTTQREIVAAYRQRERDAAAIAKSEAAAWAQHEAEQLATTKRAEKEGEAIVANANAQKVKSSKQAETQRRQDTRAALADIARMERERRQIVEQNARAIATLAKTEADNRIREGRRAANEIINSLRQQTAEAAELARRQAAAASSRSAAFLAGAAGGVTALLGVSAVNEIREAGAAWLDYSSKLETTKIAFTTMLGSARLAEEHLKELQQFALKTPFQFGELIDASQRMQALGFNAEQVIPVLTDVGNAVAAAGGGSERLDRVVLALSQIQSKGKVMTQELNQLAEAGIPAFKILQETLHKSRAEINELVKDGQISSKVFLDAFQKFSQQNFGGLMEQQSRTFSGAMSNIKDALLQTSATAFEPLFKKLSDLAKAFADAATSSKDFQDKLKVVGDASATIFDGLVELVIALRDAIRLAVAAISAQFTLFIEGARSVAHALTAVFFQAFAVGKALRGDFAGALKANRIAQEELKLAADSATKAFNAQGEVVKTISTIYKEAEARAKAFKDAQANVGIDPGDTGLRKKQTETPNEDLTKTTKGSDPAQAAKRIAEIRLRAVLDGIELEEEAIERSLRKREIDYTRYALLIEVLENKRTQVVTGGLLSEARAAEQLRDANAKRVALAEIEARRVQENNRHQSEVNKLADKTFERDKQIADALKGFRDKQIEQLRQLIEGNKTALDEANDFIVAYEKMGGVLDENQKKWLRFDAVLIESKKHTKELLESLTELVQEGIGKLPDLTPEQERGNVLTPEDLAKMGEPPGGQAGGTRSAVDQLFEAIHKNLTGDTQNAALAGLEAMTEAFEGLGNAVGQVIESFVLYGSAGTSVRKVTAEILAGVARQAAVKAVFELAEGFAALALAFFGIPNAGPSASAHFTAAAIYAGIAGVAALAGRGVAGNAFQKSVGGSSGSATGGGSGGSSRGGGSNNGSSSPAAVSLDRDSFQSQTITRELVFKVKGDAVVDKVVEDFNLNGRTRIIIKSEQ